MGKKRSPEEKARQRATIYKLLDELFELEKIGWCMDAHLKACGDALCSDNRPQYRPEGLSDYEYHFYLNIALQNKIPATVYKDRLRRGKSVIQAATLPYEKRGDHPEKPFMDMAEKIGISNNTYISRRARGWTKERAATTKKQRTGERD